MVTPTIATHDLLLSDGSTTIGLMLVKDKDGIPSLTRYCAPSLSLQQFTALNEAAFPPTQQAYVTQEDWCGGFGKQNYSLKRYMQTHGVDNSVKGLSYPSPVPVASTNSNPTTTGYNLGFETSTTIGTYGWVSNWGVLNAGATSGYVVDTAVFDAGAQSLRASGNGAFPATFTLQQALGVTTANNTTITVTVRTRAITTNGELRVRILNAAETELDTETFVLTADAGWVTKTATYTFVGVVTNPILELKLTETTLDGAWMDTVTVTWGGTALATMTMGTIYKILDFNATSYAITSTGVWKRTAANWTWVGGSPPGCVDAAPAAGTVDGGSVLALCRGASLNYWLMLSNESFYVNSGSGSPAKVEKWEAINSLDYTSRSPQTVYKMASILAGTATTTYTVGQVGFNITKIVNHLESPFIVKENGLFYISSAGSVIEVMTDLRSLYNTNTGKNTISWNGKLYVPAGNQALLEYDAGDVASIGANKYNERLSDFSGQIGATASDDEWLFSILDNSTKIEILKGRYETIEDLGTDWRWHPIIEDTYGTVSYAYVSGITAQRLWYGGGTSLPKYIPLPTKYGDPLNDTTLTFQNAVTEESPWFDFGLSMANKTLLSFLLHSTALSTGHQTIKVEYQLWGEASTTWTEVGGSGQGSFVTSPTEEKFFGSGIVSKKVRFRFTFYTDDTTVGHAVTGFTCYAIVNPLRLTMTKAQVRVADDNVLRNGAIDLDMTYAIVSAQLHTWKDTHPLTVTLPDGTGLTMKFDEGFPVEHFIKLGFADPVRSSASIFDLQFIGQRVTSFAGPVTSEAYKLPTGRTSNVVIALANASSISKEQADVISDGSNLSALTQEAASS